MTIHIKNLRVRQRKGTLTCSLLGRVTHNSPWMLYEWNFFMSQLFFWIALIPSFTKKYNRQFNQPFLWLQLTGTAGYPLAPVTIMCAPQLAGLLACWSARGDYQSVGQCQETAEALFHCMRTSVRWILSLSPFAVHVGLILFPSPPPSFCYSRCQKKVIDQQSIITLHGWENRSNETSKPTRTCDLYAWHKMQRLCC